MQDGRRDGWRILDAERVVDDRWLRVDRERLQRPDGVVLDPFWVVHEASWACCLAQRPDGLVPMVEQYRRGADAVTWELPAGDIDPGEDPATAALRELLEETGHQGQTPPRPLGAWHPDPARNTCRATAWFCRAVPVAAAAERAAGVRCRLWSVGDLESACVDGRIAHPVHCAAVLAALRLNLLQGQA